MTNTARLTTLLLAFFLAAAFGGDALAEEWSTDDCMECHADGSEGASVVDPKGMARGVHADLSCSDCHEGIEDIPHADELAKVDCGTCHDDVADIYTLHGLGKVGESDAIPTCVECHGAHGILSISDLASPVNPKNLPETCGSCHEDDKFTEKHEIRFKHPVRVYSSSVHGRAALGGVHAAASCNDCHSTGGTAHRILAPGDSESTINHFNISRTCGKCHRYIAQDYDAGIHGQMTRRGQVESPTCTTCHGEHNILPAQDPRSPVSPNRLAEATCAPCHESAFLNEKYELPTGRLTSFQDSYHGLKSKAGDTTVANCASCHGAHRILPSSDEDSTVFPGNLEKTCGSCHPNITAEVAATPIHQASGGLHTGIAGIVRTIYIILIFVVIGGMAVHWLLDLLKQIREVMRAKSVRRMDGDEVVQHFILALSFTLLVITGFSLRFYDAWWSEMLFGWEGGYSFRGDLHRISGVILLLASFWHMCFLMTRRGRAFLRDMAPRKADFTQFLQMMGYNLGMRDDHPQFGRFSYVEKAEYWALVWGTAVMGITGIALWFDNMFAAWLPKGFLDVVLVIHYYEAWLAFLAILIWHMYATVFNPKVYPMNPSWITGKMPESQFLAEHPLAAAAGNEEQANLRDEEKKSEE